MAFKDLSPDSAKKYEELVAFVVGTTFSKAGAHSSVSLYQAAVKVVDLIATDTDSSAKPDVDAALARLRTLIQEYGTAVGITAWDDAQVTHEFVNSLNYIVSEVKRCRTIRAVIRPLEEPKLHPQERHMADDDLSSRTQALVEAMGASVRRFYDTEAPEIIRSHFMKEIPSFSRELREERLHEVATKVLTMARINVNFNVTLNELLYDVANSSGAGSTNDRIQKLQHLAWYFAGITARLSQTPGASTGVYVREQLPSEVHCAAEGTQYAVEIHYDERADVDVLSVMHKVVIRRWVPGDDGNDIRLTLRNGEAVLVVFDEQTMRQANVSYLTHQNPNFTRGARVRRPEQVTQVWLLPAAKAVIEVRHVVSSHVAGHEFARVALLTAQTLGAHAAANAPRVLALESEQQLTQLLKQVIALFNGSTLDKELMGYVTPKSRPYLVQDDAELVMQTGGKVVASAVVERAEQGFLVDHYGFTIYAPYEVGQKPTAWFEVQFRKHSVVTAFYYKDHQAGDWQTSKLTWRRDGASLFLRG